MTNTTKTWQILLLGILLGLLAAGLVLLLSAPPRGNPIMLVTSELNQSSNNDQSPSEAEAVIFVHVAGAVNNPGLCQIQKDARVNDAINAAGGMTDIADMNRVNLAALLTDGSRVYIPQIGEQLAPEDMVYSSALTHEGLININFATHDELISLPGIGTSKADAIIAYRQSHGDFKSVEDIMDVTGIGQSIFEQLKDLITVNQ